VLDQGPRPATRLEIGRFQGGERDEERDEFGAHSSIRQRHQPCAAADDGNQNHQGIGEEGQQRRHHDVSRERQRQTDEPDHIGDGGAEHCIDGEPADAGQSPQSGAQSCETPGTNQGLHREIVEPGDPSHVFLYVGAQLIESLGDLLGNPRAFLGRCLREPVVKVRKQPTEDVTHEIVDVRHLGSLAPCRAALPLRLTDVLNHSGFDLQASNMKCTDIRDCGDRSPVMIE
jgi:hypothetical protein